MSTIIAIRNWIRSEMSS